jgi:hypothetical protein
MFFMKFLRVVVLVAQLILELMELFGSALATA